MTLKETLRELGKHGSIYMLGWVLNSVIRIALLPLFTRYLDRSEYGTISLLDTAVEVMRILCAMGISTAIIRFFNERDDVDYRRRVVATGLSFLGFAAAIVSIGVYPFSDRISFYILGDNVPPSYFQLAFAATVLGLLRSGADSYLTAQKRSLIFVLANVAQAVLSGAINIYLVVVLRMGVKGMLLGNLFVAALISGILLFMVVKENGIGFDMPIFRGMLRFGLPLVPTVVAAALMHNLDRFIIRKYCGLAEVGLYSIAYQFPFMLNTLISGSFAQIWNASTLYAVAKSPDSKNKFAKICTYYMLFLTYMLLIISIGADTLVSILVAPSYFAAHRFIPIISLGIWGYALHIFVKVGVEITKKTYLFAINFFWVFLLNLVLNLVFIPTYGSIAAAWNTVATYFVLSIGGYMMYRNAYPMKLEWSRLITMLSLAIIFVLIAFVVQKYEIFNAIIFDSLLIISFPIVLLFQTYFFSSEEKQEIKRFIYPYYYPLYRRVFGILIKS